MAATDPYPQLRYGEGLPAFQAPPVVETVISVQFPPIRGLQVPHLGLFWAYIGGASQWPQASELPPVLRQIEQLGPQPFQPMRLKLAFGDKPEVRMQLRRDDGHQVLQVQQNRLMANWVRGEDGIYPRYTSSTRPAFFEQWRQWQAFLKQHRLPEPEPEQWEVTYVNHLRHGELWQSPADWPSLFKGGIGLPTGTSAGDLESLQAEWHYRLPEQRGRLHVDLQHVVGEEQELLRLAITARGPITEPGEPALADGIDFGRAAVVRGFADVTSDKSQAMWKPLEE